MKDVCPEPYHCTIGLDIAAELADQIRFLKFLERRSVDQEISRIRLHRWPRDCSGQWKLDFKSWKEMELRLIQAQLNSQLCSLIEDVELDEIYLRNAQSRMLESY